MQFGYEQISSGHTTNVLAVDVHTEYAVSSLAEDLNLDIEGCRDTLMYPRISLRCNSHRR